VDWDEPKRRLRRRATAAGASGLGEKATGYASNYGKLAMNGKLTRSATEVAAGSGRARSCRNSARIPPEPKTKKLK
jgi:hypothetical protein